MAERPGNASDSAGRTSRAELMEQHAAARRRRDSAALGSDEFRAAAEEIARIEIAIAALEEPPPMQAGLEGDRSPALPSRNAQMRRIERA
ncbi:MAG: hypothetical protein M3N29_08535 [Chloroflexota bacterium]|nr:hypothetical protein [Chloroflexota bacterium]